MHIFFLMKHRVLYCRMMYSMAYVFAVAIVVFSYIGIPTDAPIALAIACLVAGGFLSMKSDKDLTSFEDEMDDALKAESKEKSRVT